MKKLLLLLFFLPAVHAQIALVNQCVNSTALGASATITCSTTLNVSAGNLLALWIRAANTSNTVSSISDGGDTFTAASSACPGSGTGIGQWWYARNTLANSAAIVTVTLNSSDNFRGMWVGQFSGLDTTSPLDVSGTCNTGNSTQPVSATFTTVAANELLLTGANVGALGVTFSAGSGYTLGTQPGGTDQDMQTQYQVVSSVQNSATGGMTMSGGSQTWLAEQVTFRAPATLPTVTTTACILVTNTTAQCGGNVTSGGNAAITARGVAFGTSVNPTSPCNTAGTGTGAFLNPLSGLTPVTTYHVRACAVNSVGTAYGSDLNFTTNATSPPTGVQVTQVSPTQAILTYYAADSRACNVQVSESSGMTPLVNDVNPNIFSGSDLDSRPGNLSLGNFRTFIIGHRIVQPGNVGTFNALMQSRALHAGTLHYGSLICPGGVVPFTLTTSWPVIGNTYAEPYIGDGTSDGLFPYPWLDQTTRNSSYYDPQTGLKHVEITLPNDLGYSIPTNGASFTDAAGTSWVNPTNIYAVGMPTTTTTGGGYLWAAFKNTASSILLSNPAWDDLVTIDGTINYFQTNFSGQVSSGTDVLDICYGFFGGTCQTAVQQVTLTTSLTQFSLGQFPSNANGVNGGNGADPLLFNATPPVNRWNSYTHTGVVNVAGSVANWVSGNYFNTNWPAGVIVKLASSGDACASGTAYTTSSINSGISVSLVSAPSAGAYNYCVSPFGILIKRHTPDSRTVTLESATFSIFRNGGPAWPATADIPILSGVKLNGGYYITLATANPFNPAQSLYFFNPSTGTSILIGALTLNSNLNSSSSDQWAANSQPGNTAGPFDNVASAACSCLVLYEYGKDTNGNQIVLKAVITGAPAYQGNTGALFDTACPVTYPTLYSVSIASCHGMSMTITNLTPASLTLDLVSQFSSLPSNSGFPVIAGYGASHYQVLVPAISAGYVFVEARASANTIAVFARLNPSTGFLDNYTNTWSQPPCRWCLDHSNLQTVGDVYNYVTDQTTPQESIVMANGAGPWIVTTNTPIAASPSVTCPPNSIGAPTTGTACDTFTLNSIGGANPYEPYNPFPGPNESTNFLQTALPGDTFCVTSSSTFCGFQAGERIVFVSRTGSTATYWRPCNLTLALCTAIGGSGVKYFFAFCGGLGNGIDSQGNPQGSLEGQPIWDTTTSGNSASWTRHLWFSGDHDEAIYGQVVNGTTVPGIFTESQLVQNWCGIASGSGGSDCYRIWLGTPPTLQAAQPNYILATPNFASVEGNDASATSHLNVGGLTGSFTDSRPFGSNDPGGAITWSLVSPFSHVYLASSSVLHRKQLMTTATAGEHILFDVSGPGCTINDSTPWVYGVVLNAGECVSGSTVGQVYVSAPQRTMFICYNGQSLISIFVPGGNVAEDICVFDSSNNINPFMQLSFTPDSVGWKYGRVLSFIGGGPPHMIAFFSNLQTFADSSWVITNERWGSTYGSIIAATQIPPSLQTDSINRESFVPVRIPIQSVSGANQAEVDFGYAEYGSDGVSKFYATSRQENTIANSSTISEATPFYWASESPTPLSCLGGGSCVITIPGLPNHVLYYRVRHLSSGTNIQTEPTQAIIVSN